MKHILKKNCLAIAFPEIAKEWHPKNTLKATEVTASSSKKFLWLGSCGHEWEAIVSNRTGLGSGCPYCSNKKVNESNCLATTHPNLAKLWHPHKNTITPKEVTKGSNKEIWWYSSVCGHEWKQSVKGAFKNCPYCKGVYGYLLEEKSLANLYPELCKEWDIVRNENSTPKEFSFRSGIKVWWLCPKGHSYQAKICNRTGLFKRKDGIDRGSTCPYCRGLLVSESNSLATKRPDLVKEWHPSKNGTKTPNDVCFGSHQKVWWFGSCGHEWDAPIGSRTNMDSGCPYCHGSRVCADNCLAAKFPEITKQWHPSKNLPLTPFEVTSASTKKKIWWICEQCNNSWQATIANRTRGETRCPFCSNPSKGEDVVCEILDILGVNYERQYRIPECKNKRALPFDFAVKQGNTMKLIEFQGEQHYRPVRINKMPWAQAVEKHLTAVRHDLIKLEYCKKNDIELLVIPYNKMIDVKGMIVGFLSL